MHTESISILGGVDSNADSRFKMLNFGNARYYARRILKEIVDRPRIVPGREPVEIRELISPLRLDILVRAEFFQFLRENQDLYHHDFTALVERASSTPYYVWWQEVACARFRPGWRNHPQSLQDSFAKRVRMSGDLLVSFQRHGLLTKYPIQLVTGRKIGPTATGKKVKRSLYAGDGCHRLALLWQLNKTHLPPDGYVVAVHRTLAPLDNTSILLRHLDLDAEDYFRFLSLGYSNTSCRSRRELIALVGAKGKDALQELESVLNHDLERMAEQSP